MPGAGDRADDVGAAAGLGFEHVGAGPDHLLFLLLLLVPAPLVATGGRWRRQPSARRSVACVIHVVTAFAVGHSLTLALAAGGLVQLPSRPVELLIALSIAVAAVHAVRPVVPRGELWIAGGFGLVHGLAFAALVGGTGLDGVTTLLAFNLGVELMQLAVVALILPSLLLLARTALYPAVRLGVALIGLAFSVSWMLERAGLTGADPFAGAQLWLVEHPLHLAATVAALALLADRVAPRARSASPLAA